MNNAGMKTLFLSVIIQLAFHHLNAQSIERQVIASGGVSVISPLQLDYTIGELAVTPITVGNTTLTQGFQQPYFVVISGNNIFPYLVIYPNPTPGDALARFVLPSPAKLSISIYNAIGQLISTEAINYTGGEMQYVIKSNRFSAGSYFIHFALSDGSAKTSKVLIKVD
jgi:hypothetical protein